MIFSILIILVVLGVTYMHYLQGAFTAAISVGCAVVAALVAFGYYETAVNSMPQNGFADYAAGLTLIVLFAVTYLALRILADLLVPGNIALPLYVERVGAAALGLLAGMIGGGVFAVGVQMLPLGPSVAGYSPYEMRDRTGVVVPAALTGRTRSSDSGIQDELVVDKFDATRSNLLLPADSLVLAIVKAASDGALSGSQSFAAIHPDLTAEAFYARLGADHSTKHVTFNTAKQTNVKVDGLFSITDPVQALDAELPELRPNKQGVTWKPTGGDALLVVRADFADPAADKDGFARLTPAAARLVIGDQTYFPIGSMEGGVFLALNRLDDLLAVPFAGTGRTIDLVYEIPKTDLDGLSKPADPTAPLFVEFKLFGRVPLAGMKPDAYATADKPSKVVRKALSPLGLAAKITPIR